MKKILILIAGLIVCLGLFTGCNEETPVLPDTPEAIEDVRDAALEEIQTFVTDNEGVLADSLTTLISAGLGDQTTESSEYLAMQQTLASFVEENKAGDLFILVKNEEGVYQKTISSEENSVWLEEYDLTSRIAEEVEAGLLSSAKCGHDNLWPVYAPLYNSAGEIAGIAVLEVPFDFTDYPEWDKNSESWHGIE